MTSSIGYSKGRVLYLYRRILKLGKAWEGTQEEKEYIFTESRALFRKNKGVDDADEAAKLIQEGEERYEYAQHYHIPYPRLQHASQFNRRYFLDAPKDEPVGSELDPSESNANTKLAAAAARRKAKLKQQKEQQTS